MRKRKVTVKERKIIKNGWTNKEKEKYLKEERLRKRKKRREK